MTSRVHPDEQVFLLLSQTYALSKKMADKELARLSVTHAEYALLRVLQNTPDVTASDIQARLFISAPSVAQLIKSVEGKGLILRTTDAADTRRQFVRLTRSGMSVVERARKAIQSALKACRFPVGVMKALISDLNTLSDCLTPHSPLPYGK